jgi:CRISPR-associated protein Cmr1
MKTKKVIFHFETVTPMFLGGANSKIPELRPPSIKGMLRFWWRAMNAHLVEKKNNKWDYSKLKAFETAIFGGVSPALRSNVILRVTNRNLSQPTNFKELENKSKKKIMINNRSVSAIKYTGFGLYDFKDSNKNSSYFEGSWDLVCEYPEGEIEQNINGINVKLNVEYELKLAFSMLNWFGSLGSKARNGFGSVQLHSKDFPLFNETEIKQLMEKKYPNVSDEISGVVPYTAPNKIKVVKSGTANNSIEALEDIAVTYRNTKKRIRPNYFIASSDAGKLGERYPKRYWFSVKKTNDGKFKWQCLYLPALIEGDKENYKKQNSNFQEQILKEK